MAKARAQVYVTGTVQGVFFRDSLRQMADLYGVTGWTRNTLDGRVEAILEGEEDALRLVIEWCHQGPPAAAVEDVDVQWAPYQEEFSEFHVRR
jgi:acylphosphatase